MNDGSIVRLQWSRTRDAQEERMRWEKRENMKKKGNSVSVRSREHRRRPSVFEMLARMCEADAENESEMARRTNLSVNYNLPG